MNKKLLLIIFFALLLSPLRVAAGELEMLVINYPPLAFLESDKLMGVAPEVVEAIQARLKDTSTKTLTPWLRGYEQAQKKSMQAIFPIVRIPKREKLFKWVGPIFGEGDYFFKRKGSPLVVKTLKDAQNVNRIAVRKKGYTHQTLSSKGFTNLDVGPSYGASYKKLVEGRVDLVLLGEKTYYYMVKSEGLAPELFERTKYKLDDSSAWIAFSKDVPDATIKKWQKALDSIKSNGIFNKIMEQNFSR